ncbi:hypothetical protein D3C73_1516440 [compost metagenome]
MLKTLEQAKGNNAALILAENGHEPGQHERQPGHDEGGRRLFGIVSKYTFVQQKAGGLNVLHVIVVRANRVA